MTQNRCRGCNDLGPEEMLKFRLAESVFIDTALKWGYEEVRTPILEYLNLFTSAGTLTPGMLRQVYSFLDWDGWSGERVVMRPDGTIPLARYFVDNLADRDVVRLFYVVNVFRFKENPEEKRERWQCGAELIGANSGLADAELVRMSVESLELLGIGTVIKLSHSGFIQAVLAQLEPNPEARHQLFDEILDGNATTLNSLKARCPELTAGLEMMLNVTGSSADYVANVKALFGKTSELDEACRSFQSTLNILDSLDIEYVIDLAAGRGFEYYTGLIMHIFTNDILVGGGGRYDNLVGQMGGDARPAAGFALYMDEIMDFIDYDVYALDEPDRFLLTFEAGNEAQAFAVATDLRDAGYTAEIKLGDPDTMMYDWVLGINDGGTLLMTDTETEEEFEFETVEELIEMLGGEASEE
ncbi:MAG: ATP phosphoribosyltransferase regulatory subunit [Dehalogenimonas sp.]|uniref:ATP phosphoribosyltransferase regulatory subunit n=1 Tax=Candidatus Dehalogenimonas loeffleri TaxID=3127115 RepID=A0ABZ2J2Z4_9CHLR|nr:ATP phosphoribosyltransferase regulatory subunit [Dehalogenimonas sp.]